MGDRGLAPGAACTYGSPEGDGVVGVVGEGIVDIGGEGVIHLGDGPGAVILDGIPLNER